MKIIIILLIILLIIFVNKKNNVTENYFNKYIKLNKLGYFNINKKTEKIDNIILDQTGYFNINKNKNLNSIELDNYVYLKAPPIINEQQCINKCTNDIDDNNINNSDNIDIPLNYINEYINNYDILKNKEYNYSIHSAYNNYINKNVTECAPITSDFNNLCKMKKCNRYIGYEKKINDSNCPIIDHIKVRCSKKHLDGIDFYKNKKSTHCIPNKININECNCDETNINNCINNNCTNNKEEIEDMSEIEDYIKTNIEYNNKDYCNYNCNYNCFDDIQNIIKDNNFKDTLSINDKFEICNDNCNEINISQLKCERPFHKRLICNINNEENIKTSVLNKLYNL
jgi:hypothetical protein